MHYLYFVATKKGDTKELDEIQNNARQVLENNDFAGEGGFWNGSKADWFVVGGRWSGHLQEIQLDDFHKKSVEIIGKDKDGFISMGDIEKNKDKLQELWVSLGGTGQNTWDRNNYKDDGETDDTMLLDKKLYEALKNHKYTETEVAIVDDSWVEDEMLMKNFLEDESNVDNYYLTIIDYHN